MSDEAEIRKLLDERARFTGERNAEGFTIIPKPYSMAALREALAGLASGE